MSVRVRIEVLHSIQDRLPRVLVVAAMAALAACGNSDGSVGVGTGQDPDPVALDFPVAYTKGPLRDENMVLQTPTDVRDVQRFNVGTDLYLLDRASPGAAEQNITIGETLGLGDVRGVEISTDGTRVLFAMRGPFDESLDDDDQPTWNIWEYDIPTMVLRRIIGSDITAEAGHDIDPYYLSDGRIIFSSTRQRQSNAILLDEGKPQFEGFDESFGEPAFVLHVMDADGSNMRQVSFNLSHDLEPTLRDNGKVLFTRWENAGSNNAMHLYQMNPDGSALELLYGAESHATGTDGSTIQFVGPREMRDGRIMAIARQFDHPELGGDVISIDVETYVENMQPVVSFFGMTGPAQASVTTNQARTDDLRSPGGRFSSAFPLWDGTDRVLVAWSGCRLIEDPLAPEPVIGPCTPEALADPSSEIADPLYGIWIYDPIEQTQLPVVIGEENVLIADIAAAQPRPNPISIPDAVPGIDTDPDLVAENVGILNIRSVYDIDGIDAADPNIATVADPSQTPADQRLARFLRLEKGVAIPDPDIVALEAEHFGPDVLQGMREIVGYAPIEPDGSVRIKVPANVALAVSVLDVDGRRISARHQNWLQVMPGQELTCNGCHAPQSGVSHGRSDSFAAVNAGALATGVPFPNTVPNVSPDMGETMAEARTRFSCISDCAALEPSLDVVYDEFWTDFDPPDPDDGFAYSYSALDTPPPTSLECMTEWDGGCRSVINYETHIHPLWSLPRPVLDPVDNVTVIGDRTCTQAGCHSPPVPAAQLDLSDGLSAQVMEHFNAYRELLFADDGLAPAPMDADGANASAAFFAPFDSGTHIDYLTPDELRLISEWLDLGAQYYNNPFDVPQN